jgi:hypothetical protein
MSDDEPSRPNFPGSVEAREFYSSLDTPKVPVKISDPDKYGVINYKYPFPLTHCQANYLNELQLPQTHENRKEFTRDIRELSNDYDFITYCLNPRIFAFLITWQRVELFITDKEAPVSIEIINFIRELATNEIALSTEPIMNGSILHTALIALGLVPAVETPVIETLVTQAPVIKRHQIKLLLIDKYRTMSSIKAHVLRIRSRHIHN